MTVPVEIAGGPAGGATGLLVTGLAGEVLHLDVSIDGV